MNAKRIPRQAPAAELLILESRSPRRSRAGSSHIHGQRSTEDGRVSHLSISVTGGNSRWPHPVQNRRTQLQRKLWDCIACICRLAARRKTGSANRSWPARIHGSEFSCRLPTAGLDSERQTQNPSTRPVLNSSDLIISVRHATVTRAGGGEPASMVTQRQLSWRKSTACVTGECVEVAYWEDLVLVRSSRAPEIVVPFSRLRWRAFITSITTPVGTLAGAVDRGLPSGVVT
jgi:Domain of unknown function (DUF397)